MKQTSVTEKVVILDNVFSEHEIEKKILVDNGYTVSVHNPESDAEIKQITSTADGIIVNMHVLTAEIISGMENCRIISRYGTGFDNVDCTAAEQKGIWVANVPDYCIEEASDHTMSLILACTRQTALKDRLIRGGAWKLEQTINSLRIAGKTLGIIGFGKIGQAVCRKMRGWDLGKILVFDPWQEEAIIRDAGALPALLEEVLMHSDIITLHVPLTETTTWLVDKTEISLMKHSAILINTSRGKIINEAALFEALKKNRISGAGLDVYEKEPLEKDNPFLTLDNIVLSDHTAYHSGESIIELKTLAALNVVETFKEGKPLYPVNRIRHYADQKNIIESRTSIY